MYIPENIESEFNKIKKKYGKNSLNRVEQMIECRAEDRDHSQAKAKWILPGLSKSAWLDTSILHNYQNLVSDLENNSTSIKDEILKVLRNYQFEPYKHYLGTTEGWNALYIYQNGATVEKNRASFPTVYKLYEETIKNHLCPLLEMHFSILKPGTVIPPHCDLWNFSVNLHLALSIPENCGISVNGSSRTWQEGKCLLFDYSFIHYAWNKSDQHRICLLMDIWHPDVTQPEKEALTVFITELRRLLEH